VVLRTVTLTQRLSRLSPAPTLFVYSQVSLPHELANYFELYTSIVGGCELRLSFLDPSLNVVAGCPVSLCMSSVTRSYSSARCISAKVDRWLSVDSSNPI
jgi:hypothetical protein